MKKTLIALAAVAATGAAFAQSSVTIDGQVSLGVTKLNDRSASLDSLNGTNQIRFRGVEDLGGGLKASFTLAQRFSPENGGNDGTTFSRPTFQGESSIGLSGGFGAIKLGRALHAYQLGINTTDPFAVAYIASTGGLSSGLFADASVNGNKDGGGQGRTDAISYTTPTMGGFSAALAYGPKGSQGADQADGYTSLWLNYAAGPLLVAGGAEQTRDGVGKGAAILATYDLGFVKIGGGYGTTTVNVARIADGAPTDLTAPTLAVAGNKMKNWNIMAVAPLGAVTLKVGYVVAKNDTTDVDVSKKLGIGADYNLSKRTWVYSTVFRDSARTSAGARNGVELGMRHTF